MEKQEQGRQEKGQSFVSRLEESVFYLFDHLVTVSICNSIALIIAIILEALIFISIFMLLLESSADVSVNFFYDYLEFVNPAYLISLSSYSMYVVISFIGFGVLFTLLFIVLLVSHWNSDTELRHSLAYSYILRIAGLILVIIKYVLFQPMVTVLMTTVRCTKSGLTEDVSDLGYTCYDEVHIILMVCASLVIVMLIVLSVFSILFYADEDPESRLPWAYCSRLMEVYKMLRKLLVSIAIYATSENTGTGAATIIFALLLSVLSLLLLYKQLHMRDRKILYALLTAEGMITWFILLSLVLVVTGLDWTHPISILVFVLVFFTCVVLLNQERCDSLLCLQSIDSLKESVEVETYCRILLEKLHTSKNGSEVAIEGFIQMHTVNCKVEQCPCKKKFRQTAEKDDDEEEVKLQALDDVADCKKLKPDSDAYAKGTISHGVGGIVAANDLKQSECQANESGEGGDKVKQDFVKIVINDLLAWNERIDGKARLHIYLGYLKASCLKNKLAALYEVMCAEESNPDIYERFLAYRLMRRIEDQIVKKESREHSSSEIDNLIQFQQILAEMQENMQEVLKLFIGFWKELQDESPNFQYLGNMSHDISQNAIKIRGQYRKLIAINPTNLYCRMLYALFLKKIMKDEFEAYDVYDETNRANNNLRIQNTHFNDDKYGANSRTALFIISGTKVNMGEVLCINNEVSELLGYEKNEIVGHNVSKVMPPMIGEKHSEMVFRYLCSGKLDRAGEKMVIALHKYGYIVPCSYLHRVVPNLHRGLQLIGFVYKINDFSEYCPIVERNISPDDVMIMLTDQNWMMQAFNIKASKFFGINPLQANLKKYIFGEEKISVCKLIPQLEDPGFVQAVNSSLSAEVMLDAALIRKTIDAEIEVLRAVQGEEGETGTPVHKDELEKGLESSFDNCFKGPLTYMELNYGKYEADKKCVLNMKLVVIVVEQLLEKDKPVESSNDFMINPQTKKQVFVDYLYK